MPGKPLREMTKRELVARLLETISSWDGVEPLGRTRERELNAVLDVLELARMFVLERHVYLMCRVWLAEGCRKPSDNLRDEWLVALDDWRSYMNENGFFADECV